MGSVRLRGQVFYGGTSAGNILPPQLGVHASAYARRRNQPRRIADALDPGLCACRLFLLSARAFPRAEPLWSGARRDQLRAGRLYRSAVRIHQCLQRLCVDATRTTLFSQGADQRGLEATLPLDTWERIVSGAYFPSRPPRPGGAHGISTRGLCRFRGGSELERIRREKLDRAILHPRFGRNHRGFNHRLAMAPVGRMGAARLALGR